LEVRHHGCDGFPVRIRFDRSDGLRQRCRVGKGLRCHDFGQRDSHGQGVGRADGCSVVGGANAATATTLGTVAGVGTPGTAVQGQAADLIYVDATGWVSVTASSVASIVTVKNYLIGINDKNGMPWWDVKGGH
jgi:hypothetical protein